MSNICFLYPKTEFDEDVLVETQRDWNTNKYLSKPVGTLYKQIYEQKCECGCRSTFIGLNDAVNFVKECPQCGSKNFVELDKKYNSKMFNASYVLVSKEGRNFNVSSKRHKVLFKKDDSIVIKDIGEDNIIFENGKMKIVDYRGVTYYSNSTSNNVKSFMTKREIREYDILRVLSEGDAELYAYYLFLYERFKKHGKYYYRERNLEHALYMDALYNEIERLYKAGINHELIVNIIDNLNRYDRNGKKLHQFFKTQKVAMRLVKKQKYLNYGTMDSINKVLKSIDGNTFNKVLDIMEEETIWENYDQIDLLNYLVRLKEVGYKNVEHLANYICRRTKLEQGFDNPVESARYLYDYASIMKELNFNIDKYPSSLKKVHDIAVMNKNALNQSVQSEKFNKIVNDESYKGLEMKGKVVSIVSPKEPNDVIKEGQSLSHCVASYVKDIANGLCKILFLRFTNAPEQSYMTIEVRGNEIKQFKGISNRRATQMDLEFLTNWAKKRNLVISNANSL